MTDSAQNQARAPWFAALRGIRLCGLTLYLRDPGVGARYWHYRGHKPRLISGRWCRWIGHSWHRWEGGHVYAGDEWQGERLSDGTPWAPSFRTCERDGCKYE